MRTRTNIVAVVGSLVLAIVVSLAVSTAWAEEELAPCIPNVAVPFEDFDFVDVIVFLRLVEEQDSRADIALPGGAPDAIDIETLIAGSANCH